MHDVLTSFYVGQQVGVCGFRGGFTDATITAVQPNHNHLGGRWSTLGIILPDGEAVTIDSRQHVIVSAERYEDAWCPTCKTRVEVEEQFMEDTGDQAVVVTEYAVTRMVCGHNVTAVTREYPSPLQQASVLPRGDVPDPYQEEPRP